jgi:thiol-disulfide isomerase/thioredoxin
MKVLKFSAKWCGPCKIFKPVFDKVVNEVNIKHEEIDIDSEVAQELNTKYNIRSVPTVILLDDINKVVKRNSGVMTEDQFREWLIIR